MFSRFFIDRPVFAMVLSIAITLAGAVSIPRLPIVQYPPISPPVVQITATYPGASAQVVEQTVATPIEQQVNGVPNMIYMSSKSSNNGALTIQVYFEVGTNLDIAAVDVQNRVALAQPTLPQEVVRQGLSIKKQSPDMLLVITMTSADPAYDDLFLSNYASINLMDQIARVNGVGDIRVRGRGDYGMRVWIDPDKLTQMGLTVSDVTAAIREQNLQAPTGQIGAQPVPAGQEFQYTVRTKGRLTDVEEFAGIIIRANADSSIVRLRDVARIELDSQNFENFTRYNGKPATAMIVSQTPGANALDVADAIKALMVRESKKFPQGIEYGITYDNTQFVRQSIKDVVKTLWEAIALVVLVTFVFLQGWRPTLIPLLAVPVSLVGTFLFFGMIGFSINTLTMFALVLAIGLVVDDAIVVVEAVESYLEKGFAPREATIRAMQDVSMPIVAIALALFAVFVPVAFMSGITGKLYQQFAITMIIAVALSALNSLTLSPALATLLLRKREHSGGGPLRFFYAGFNTVLGHVTGGYSRLVRAIIRKSLIAIVVVLVAGGLAWKLNTKLPSGFIPDEDRGVVLASIQLPNAASLERTDKLVSEVEKKAMEIPGVRGVLMLGGNSIVAGINSSNAATLITPLDAWDERKTTDTSLQTIMGKIGKLLGSQPGAIGFPFQLPAIPGVGSVGGVQFELQDRGGNTVERLDEVTRDFIAEALKQPEIAAAFTGFTNATPQIFLDVDREKAKTQGVDLDQLFSTIQTYLGGSYVNDFNLFGRTYRVMLQAEPEYRRTPQDLKRFYVRNRSNEMVPVGAFATTSSIVGPDYIVRYNLYRAAEINVSPNPGFSSGQVIQALERVAKTKLPDGFGFEYSGLAFQEARSGNQTPAILAMAAIFMFLVLAAQYESWTTPLAVLLAIPIGICGAVAMQVTRGMENNLYFQIGLVMLIGLAAKNAILIVEFARERRMEGMPLEEAAVEGARARLRPILMTSFAFILGCLPLMLSTGAGANSRRAMGTAVVGGMLAATMVAVLVIPTLYVFSQRLFGKSREAQPAAIPPDHQLEAPAAETPREGDPS